MVDELGRGTKSDITVEDVTFGKLDNIKVYRYTDDVTFSTDSPVADDAYIAANGNSKVAYVPGTGERIVPMDTENNRNNALSLDTELSEGDDTEGYTLLVYSVGMLYDSETWETPSDTERIIDLYSFTAGAERDTWEETLAVATHIDNTQPESAVGFGFAGNRDYDRQSHLGAHGHYRDLYGLRSRNRLKSLVFARIS